MADFIFQILGVGGGRWHFPLLLQGTANPINVRLARVLGTLPESLLAANVVCFPLCSSKTLGQKRTTTAKKIIVLPVSIFKDLGIAGSFV